MLIPEIKKYLEPVYSMGDGLQLKPSNLATLL
jgi:hypothetical protein